MRRGAGAPVSGDATVETRKAADSADLDTWEKRPEATRQDADATAVAFRPPDREAVAP